MLFRSQVESGRYPAAIDVISDALRLLGERQNLIDDLESKIDRGLDDVMSGRTHAPDEARAILRKLQAARSVTAK